jgi:hypothetical protein
MSTTAWRTQDETVGLRLANLLDLNHEVTVPEVMADTMIDRAHEE